MAEALAASSAALRSRICFTRSRTWALHLLDPLGVALGAVLALAPLVAGAGGLHGLVQRFGGGEGRHGGAGEDDHGVEVGGLVAHLDLLALAPIGLVLVLLEGPGREPGAERLDQLAGLEPLVEQLLGGGVGALAGAELDHELAFVGGGLQRDLEALFEVEALLALVEDGGGHEDEVVDGADANQHGDLLL